MSDEKQCPHCAETIKAAAKVCRFCGRDLEEDEEEVQAVKARSGVMDGVKLGCGMFIVLPILLFVGGVLFFACMAGLGSSLKPAGKSTGGSNSPKLEVVKGFTWEASGDYDYVRGSVKNSGDIPIRYFKVRAEFLDKKGRVVDTDYTNSGERLEPGQRKKFEIMHRSSPEYKSVSVSVDEASPAR